MKAEEYFNRTKQGKFHKESLNHGIKQVYLLEEMIEFAEKYAKHVLKEDRISRELTGRY